MEIFRYASDDIHQLRIGQLHDKQLNIVNKGTPHHIYD